MAVTYFLRIALFTIVQALLSTALAGAVGLGMAFFLARRMFPFRRLLRSFSVIPLCLPALIMALGYVTVFGRSGCLSQLLAFFFGKGRFQLTFLYSVFGIVLAQGFFNFPLVMATVADSWSRLPSGEADSARLLGASEGRVFFTVTIYQLASAIVSACIPVFLFCFFSFLIVLLFGGVRSTTLEVEIFRNVRSDGSRTLVLCAIETFIALAVVALHSLFEQKTLAAGSRGLENMSCERKKMRFFSEGLPFCFLSLLIFLFFLAPLLGILWNGLTAASGKLTGEHFSRIFRMQSFGKALKGTLVTALATGCCSTIIAFGYSVFLHSHVGLARRLFFRIIPMMPMALSSVVLAAVLIRLIPRGSLPMLICAQTGLYWPFAFRQVYAELSKIPRETLEAARLLSPRPLEILWRIYLPCSRHSCMSALACCFALSAGDTSLPLVLGLPGFNSLALFTYRLSSSYRFHEACASGMLLALLCMLLYSAGLWLKKLSAFSRYV